MSERSKVYILLTFLILYPAMVSAEFDLEGTMTGEPSSDDPTLGFWKYTLTVTWDTGTAYGLSHLDLIVDNRGLCDCNTVLNALNWNDPSGFISGYPTGCSLDLMTELNCNGDPSLGLDGIILKLEPYEIDGCEAGNSGELTVVFYSSHAPVSIDEPNLALIDKFGQLSGWGNITGVFPGIPCDTVESGVEYWGTIKTQYR